MHRLVILLANVFVLCSVIPKTMGKTFDTCELVTELTKQRFQESQLRDWICLIEAESTRQTDVIGGPDEDGSFDYGLFQINDRYWCSNDDRPDKGCNIQCKDLLTDNITAASECAKTIYAIQGFSAWLGWKKECRIKKPELNCE